MLHSPASENLENTLCKVSWATQVLKWCHGYCSCNASVIFPSPCILLENQTPQDRTRTEPEKRKQKKISQKSRNKISPAIHVFTPFQPSLLAARNPWVSCPSPARCRRGRRWTRRALAGFHGENCKALGCQGKDYRIYSIFWKHVFAARTSWRIRLGSSWMQLLGKPEHQCFFISCSVRWFGKG